MSTEEQARKVARAGADVIVVDNLLQAPGFEKNLREITTAIKKR